MKDFITLASKLKLSFIRAYIGEVSNKLVAVTLGYEGNLVKGFFYYEEEPSEEDIESVSFIEGEVIADFTEEYKIEFKALRCESSEKMEMLDFWAFKRRE
ncbi:MAG TPA: hypothetical protein V6C96_04545 [Vampirovibrionales bacterium]